MIIQIWLCILALCMPIFGHKIGLVSEDLLVTTDVGTFNGTLASPTVRQWLGVPFGASTEGKQRFQPPQPASKLPDGTVFQAVDFGLGCPQNKGAAYAALSSQVGEFGTGSFAEGDDCLNLNIWSPTLSRSGGRPAAVLVWIFGGGGQLGGTAAPEFLGNNFVRDQEDVVIVSINYRINIFGSHPRSAYNNDFAVNNPGLMDQRLAVEWIHSHIEKFGGDPARITLFGESAGAGAVAAYSYAYRDDPLVSGLIMQSGTETVFDPFGQGENTTAVESAWEQVASYVGCPSSQNGSQVQLACMQAVPWQKLQEVISSPNVSTAFGTVVDNRTLFSQQQYTQKRANGDFARLPVLVGSNNDEGEFLAPFLLGPVANSSFGPALSAIASHVVTLYGFTCPATAVVSSRLRHNVPAYQYRYFGSYPNLSPVPGAGAYHGSEVSMVWGTYNGSAIASPTREQIDTSLYMQSAWAAFARDPSKGLDAYGWRSARKNTSVLNGLAMKNRPGVSHLWNSRYTFGCGVLLPELMSV